MTDISARSHERSNAQFSTSLYFLPLSRIIISFSTCTLPELPFSSRAPRAYRRVIILSQLWLPIVYLGHRAQNARCGFVRAGPLTMSGLVPVAAAAASRVAE